MNKPKINKDQGFSLREIKRRALTLGYHATFTEIDAKSKISSNCDYVASESGPRDQYEKEFIATIDKISD